MSDQDKTDNAQPLFGDFVPGKQDSTETPMMRAKELMKNDLPKRFYKEVTIAQEGELYRLLLDGRAIKSPAKKTIEVPKKAIAEALLLEWEAQTETIDPATMPITRLVNSAIDGVEDARAAMLDEIVSYLGNDFICYPATHPERLVERQNVHWLPVIDWAGKELGGLFIQVAGIMAIEQSPAMGKKLQELWQELDIFQLAAVHSIMTLTGSALLPFAYWKGFVDLEAMWNAAMVDEDWNIEMWGEDEEASKRRAFRRSDVEAASCLIEAFR